MMSRLQLSMLTADPPFFPDVIVNPIDCTLDIVLKRIGCDR